MDIEAELRVLKHDLRELEKRMDTADKGDYSNSPFATLLVERFNAVESEVRKLKDKNTSDEGAEQFRLSRRQKIAFVSAVAVPWLLAIFNRIELWSR